MKRAESEFYLDVYVGQTASKLLPSAARSLLDRLTT